MEGVLIKWAHHLDLNKDGKPDWDQLEALADKFGPTAKLALPLAKAFIAAGGLVSIEKALLPHLTPEAAVILKDLLAVLTPKA